MTSHLGRKFSASIRQLPWIQCRTNRNMTWCRCYHFLKVQKQDKTLLGNHTFSHLKIISNLHGVFRSYHTRNFLTNNVSNCNKLLKVNQFHPHIIHWRGYASLENVDIDLLLKYLESLDREYNEILEAYNTGSKVKDMNARKLFLMPLADLYQQIKGRMQDLDELRQLAEEDEEMRVFAEAEEKEINEQINQLKEQVLDKIVPDLKYDKNDAILDLTPGVGGEEAKLFTLDLYNMYHNFALYKGWTLEDENLIKAESGGLSAARITISGYDVFKTMKYESGTHRVQRVPKTESKGRIHTSTASVAILPKPTEIDITINPNDLKIDTFKSSGPGGQHVQKTDTAVRVTHLPTMTVVACQETRSQIENKKRAIAKIRESLYEAEFNEQMNKIISQRKLQVGTKGRSEKIRTYNIPQSRMTDHRIHYSTNVESILNGREALDELIEILQVESRKETLNEILEEFQKKHL